MCTKIGCTDLAGPDCKDVRRYYPNGEECDNGCTYCADIPEVHFSYVVITRSNITNITPWLEQEIIVESKKRISPVRYRLPENHEASLLEPDEMYKNQPNLYKSPSNV